MSLYNARVDRVWNDAVCDNADLRWISVDGVAFPEGLPLALAKLGAGVEVTFQHCSFGSFPQAALRGTGKVILRFQYCEGDFNALREQGLLHGLGRCEAQVFLDYAYERDGSFKLLYSMGLDFAGDAEMRSMGFALRRGGTLAGPATSKHLALMTWSRKPIRQNALAWLEKNWPNPLPDAPEQLTVWLMGSAVYHAQKELKERIAERGWKVTTRPDKADVAVLLDNPKDKLQRAVDAGLPILLEQQLKAHLDAAAEPGLELTEGQTDGLAAMLVNPDEGVVEAALALLKSVQLDVEVTTALVAVMMFHRDKGIRKQAKQHVLGHAEPALVERFQKDRRNYNALTNGKKMLKVAKEMEALGLQGAVFGRYVVRLLMAGGQEYLSDEAMLVPLCWPENLPGVWDELAHLKRVYLPDLKGAFWPGMDRLQACEVLRCRGKHTRPDHVEDLTRLPQLHTLEYWVRSADLSLLAPLQSTLRGLDFRGAVTGALSPTELGKFRKLERLSMGNTEIVDIGPLAGMPLTWLQMAQTPVTDLSPLRQLPGLTGLNLSRVQADFSPVSSLSKLVSLDLSFTRLDDLSFLSGLQSLESLSFSGQALDLAPLAGLPSLRSLRVARCQLSNGEALAECPNLVEVTAYGMDGDRAAHLQALLPRARVRS